MTFGSVAGKSTASASPQPAAAPLSPEAAISVQPWPTIFEKIPSNALIVGPLKQANSSHPQLVVVTLATPSVTI